MSVCITSMNNNHQIQLMNPPFNAHRKCNLTLAFLSPEKQDPWVNRLVAWASSHPFCHVELYFDTTNQCFSIQYGEVARLRKKTLANTAYEIITLNVTYKEYAECLLFCNRMSLATITFDDSAMWMSYFYVNNTDHDSITKKKTFCSKIICEALQYAKVPEVEGVNPCSATPSRLYDCVCKSNRRMCASVPYKREQLKDKTQSVVFQNRLYTK